MPSTIGPPFNLLVSRVDIVIHLEARVFVKGVIVNSKKLRSEM